MSGRYLLDTNIVIALFNNEKMVLDWLLQVSETYIPNIVIGELYYGFLKSAKKKDNIKDLEDLIVLSEILETDIETARIYGRIKNELRIKGKPIPENDIWIAAIALQHNLNLVTRDKHFENIEDLSLEIMKHS